MKTLLTAILIITCLGMMGQNDKVVFRQSNHQNTGIHFYEDSNGIHRELVVNGKVMFQPTETELILLSLLQQYQTECYNDSTLTDVYVDPNTHTEVSPGVYISTAVMGYYVKQWIHKQPTFTGFIEWLKERNNKWTKR